MFCSYCGKEIPDNLKICGYCGTPVQRNVQNVDNTGNTQGYSNQQNNSMNYLKPDNKYNLAAALFTWIWALVKGMWDLAILDFLFTFIILIPIVGAIIGFIYFWVFRIAFVGRNANYYYRLKETQKILMYKAIQDPNLRRL